MAGDSARDIARRQREKAARLERSAARWERGAQGEAATAAALGALSSRGWTTFHDVRWPGRQRANIDHVAVGPAGVFVIDSKNWTGDIRVTGDVLYQSGRRRESEVAAAADAALAVTQLLQGLPATPVLCFVRPEPLEAHARGVTICSTSNLASYLAALPPILGPESIRRAVTILQWQLTSAQRPATARAVPKAWRSPSPTRSRPPVLGRTMLRLGKAGCGLLLVLAALAVAVGLIGAVLQGIGAGATKGRSGVADGHGASRPTLGKVVRVPATDSHPALRVRADEVTRVAMTELGSAVHRGEHMVGVRYTIWNDGSEIWSAASPYLRYSALLSNGQSAGIGSYLAIPTSKLMPAAFNLRPGKAQRGLVVFEVPDGANLVRVSVQTGPGSDEGAEWLVP
jgi:hypothetical protein